MKGTKLNKILITLLCFIMVATMSATVFAKGDDDKTSKKDVKSTTTIAGVDVAPDVGGNGAVIANTIGNNIVGIIKVAGVIISVGCLMVLGIKYMMGSAEEKAEYKKTFIPYIIGAVLLFAASAFASQLYSWANSIFG